MAPEPIEEVDWDEFGVRRGNGPSYLLFRNGKVYELRTTIERDIEKLLLGFKVSRKAGKNLMPLVWDLFFMAGPLQDLNENPLQDQNEQITRQLERIDKLGARQLKRIHTEHLIRQIKRIVEEPYKPARENRADEFRGCLLAASELWHQMVPKGVTRRYHDTLPLEALFDGDDEPNAILDFSELARGMKEAFLAGAGPVLEGGRTNHRWLPDSIDEESGLAPLEFDGECVLYDCIRATKSPIAWLAQELRGVPTKRQLADKAFSSPKGHQFISQYCRNRGFGWLPTAKPGRPSKRLKK